MLLKIIFCLVLVCGIAHTRYAMALEAPDLRVGSVLKLRAYFECHDPSDATTFLVFTKRNPALLSSSIAMLAAAGLCKMRDLRRRHNQRFV